MLRPDHFSQRTWKAEVNHNDDEVNEEYARDNSGRPVMRLYLNRPALELLMGGDSEVEVTVRQQVANEFAKKFLKGVIDKEALSAIRSELEGDIREVVRRAKEEMIDPNSPRRGRIIFNTGIRESLRQQVQAEFRSLVQDVIREVIEDPASIHERVFAPMKEQMTLYAGTLVRELADKAVSERVASLKVGIVD